MKRIATIIAGIAAMPLAMAGVASAEQATHHAPREIIGMASYSDCVKGDVCFYSKNNGGGNMCAWDVDDPDWRSGALQCKGVTTPRSIYNNGYAGGYDDVVYYINTGYHDRVGCTKVGVQGNLAGTYVVRSHRWVTSC